MSSKRSILCMAVAATAGLFVYHRIAEAGAPALTTERVASGLSLPVYATHAPGDSERLFIVEQHTGRIRILNLNTGVLQSAASPFLTVSGVSAGNEQGLLGLAFHPNYQSNGFFYVNFTTNSGGNRTRIRRYTVSANPDTANPGSAFEIMTYTQPFANHNAGWIDFGPDGYLYIPTGDGGSACDPGQRAQDITSQMLGKILRIDVDGDDFPADATKNYAIPAGNPFVGITGDDEIWAYGMRNPYRCSFDRVTGDLYIGDVGQNAREEIDFQPASSAGGENYGWDCREGTACANTVSSQCVGTTNGCNCSTVNSVDPIYEFTHSGGNCALIGGYVYRGSAISGLQGTYFCADNCSDQIWSFVYDGVSVTNFENRTAELDPATFSITSISSFGEDAAGEIYICDLLGGEVFKIIPVSAPEPTGACCLSFGCIVLTDSVCGLNNGVYQGDDIPCVPTPCPQPCKTLGDMNVDGTVDGKDIGGYLRAKFNLSPIGGEDPDCADYGTGTIDGDNALFVDDLLS